jgi:4-hydroxy-tetrahydrodipicolinate reductase
VKLAVLGATGRLGRLILARAAATPSVRVVAAVTHAGSSSLGEVIGETTVTRVAPGCFAGADVIIDVSLPGGADNASVHANGAAWVSGVTGMSDLDEGALARLAITNAVLWTANFSAGVHVLAELVARAAQALPDYDVEVVDIHHRGKVDAPSGTARFLASAAAHARGQTLDTAIYGRHGLTGARTGVIALHSLRMGDVPGDHTVWLAGQGERLQLGHIATSRETFAAGALRAAAWVRGRPPGRYAMSDVLQ